MRSTGSRSSLAIILSSVHGQAGLHVTTVDVGYGWKKEEDKEERGRRRKRGGGS